MSDVNLIERSQKGLDDVTETLREWLVELTDAIAAKDKEIAVLREVLRQCSGLSEDALRNKYDPHLIGKIGEIVRTALAKGY